ncbi:MAG: SpoIIE family protein phosphatase [Armatimonadetes bacterium]|nr:SpoIIE family protein phosphatase [Armatimonadota bacterium]
MSPRPNPLATLPASVVAEIAAFCNNYAEGYGFALFHVENNRWNCAYLSDRATFFLGGKDADVTPPLLGTLTALLAANENDPHPYFFLPVEPRRIEVRGEFLRSNDAPGSASRLYQVLMREPNASQTRLREERDRLDRALTATGEAVWDWDLETGAAFVSPRWGQMLGKPAGNPDIDALYSPENWLESVHPDDRDSVADAYAAFIVGQTIDYDIEFRIRHNTGGFRWIRSQASALRRDDNTAWRVTGAHSDITDRKALENAQEALLHQQSRIAETLQRVLLPLPGGKKYPFIEVALHYEPASDEAMVGGDFCDAFPVSDREVALVVGDMMGKGLSAAVGTAELKFSLRTLLRQYRDPAIALRLLNQLLWETYTGERGQNPPLVPLSVAIANSHTQQLSVAVAGAEPPMILRLDAETNATSTEEIKVGGLMIGTLPNEDYEKQTVAMSATDCFLMTTDGLTEVRDAWTGAFLGTKGVARLTHHALSSRRPLEDITGALVRSVHNFGGGKAAMRDDVSLILARWRDGK